MVFIYFHLIHHHFRFTHTYLALHFTIIFLTITIWHYTLKYLLPFKISLTNLNRKRNLTCPKSNPTHPSMVCVLRMNIFDFLLIFMFLLIFYFFLLCFQIHYISLCMNWGQPLGQGEIKKNAYGYYYCLSSSWLHYARHPL